ncbi:MAG: ABC transporter ATP-binding protein [Dehalococcoidia bacterium]|nr:ABC transporter ATP-binding protein [Dehalococcoidia bacterium]
MATVPLRISGGTRAYTAGGRHVAAFRDVNLEVAHGEVVVLIGPSGCGKSTLLRVMAGLEPLSAGTVDWAARDGGQPSVGIAFQQPLLLPWLNVRENIALGLRYAANAAARSSEAVDRIIEEFGLTELGGYYPDEISGGQAQRVALARTAVVRPEVILLDEPFGALDPVTRASLQRWLIGIQQALDLTVVIVTHDIDEAIVLGDRIALLTPGPGTIQRIWSLDRGLRASREGIDASAIRDEILGGYGTTSPLDAGAVAGGNLRNESTIRNTEAAPRAAIERTS